MASQVRASISWEEWIFPVPAGSRTLKARTRELKNKTIIDLQSTFDHDVLGVSAVELLSKHVKEGSEVKSAGSFVHHLFDVSIFNVSDTEGHVARKATRFNFSLFARYYLVRKVASLIGLSRLFGLII